MYVTSFKTNVLHDDTTNRFNCDPSNWQPFWKIYQVLYPDTNDGKLDSRYNKHTYVCDSNRPANTQESKSCVRKKNNYMFWLIVVSVWDMIYRQISFRDQDTTSNKCLCLPSYWHLITPWILRNGSYDLPTQCICRLYYRIMGLRKFLIHGRVSNRLTHLPLEKMAAISQTIFPDAFL